MKRVGILLIILTMLFQGTVFADETVKTVEIVSFENAYNKMIENNRELSSIEKQIEIQKEIVEEVKNEASRLDGFIYDDEDKINDRATAVYVDPVVAQNKLNSLERSYDDKVFELKQSLVDYFVNFVSKDNQIALYQEVKDIYQKEYDQKALELSLGKITENDLLTYEVNLDSANKDLDNANRDKELTLMDFNYLINNSLEIVNTPDTKSLESSLLGNYVDIESINLEKLIERNIENDSTVAGYKEDIEKYEQQKHVERVYTSSVSAFKNYEQNIEDNERDTDARIKAIKFEAYTDLNTLKSLVLDVKIAQNNLTLVKSTLEATKVKNNLGIVTDLELIKAQKEVLSSEGTVTDALNAYYKAYQAFLRYY